MERDLVRLLKLAIVRHLSAEIECRQGAAIGGIPRWIGATRDGRPVVGITVADSTWREIIHVAVDSISSIRFGRIEERHPGSSIEQVTVGVVCIEFTEFTPLQLDAVA